MRHAEKFRAECNGKVPLSCYTACLKLRALHNTATRADAPAAMRPSGSAANGKERASTAEVRKFYQQGYEAYALGPGSRAVTGERTDAKRVRERGLVLADKVEQRAADVDATTTAKANLRAEWMQALKDCCYEHDLELEKMKRLFIANKGIASEHFTVQREHSYRHEFNSKTTAHRGAPPTVAADDPLVAKLCYGFDKPVHELLCDPAIQWMRPDTRMGASGYVTGGDVKLVFGRVAKTPDEKKIENAQIRDAEVKGLPPLAPMDPRPWKPMDAALLWKLRPAMRCFERCMALELGQLRAARDANNTLRRAYLQSEGQRHTRAPEKSRTEKRVRSTGDMPYQRLAERIIIMPDAVVTEEDNLHNDQYRALAHFWHMLGIMAADAKYGGSMDCLYHLIDELQRSEALVLDCDFQYEPPNGRRFRTVNETASFMRDELKQLIGVIDDASHGKSEYLSASDQYVRVYTVGCTEITTSPYAAVLHSSTGCIDLSIPLLHKYHPELYELFTAVLQDWHVALMSQNGGPSAETAFRRMSIEDDAAYGPGRRVVLVEPPPHNPAHSRGHWPHETRWRVRRLRVGESDAEGGTLPHLGFPFCTELDIGHGWMLWTRQRFYMQKEQEPGAAWFLMPFDGQGCLRNVGWLEGDDLAPEMHDYAYLDMEGGMLSELMPLLDRMFV